MLLLGVDWSSLDGEVYVGDQENFYDQQDQQDFQENFDQGMYSSGPSLLSYSWDTLKFIYMCPLWYPM